jgi:lipoprotein-releasing system ATP-binding protein
MSKYKLEIINLTKTFLQGNTKIRVLDEIACSVKEGELVSIVGQSGSGKSTLLQIIGLLDSEYTGSVLIDNVDFAKVNDNKKSEIRNNNIGFVYQFHHLLPEFTAVENIAMPLIIRGADKSYAQAKALEILKNLGLHKRSNHLPSQLSGGEQQRVAIARALIGDPQILLCDEPTGNLDYFTAGKVFDILKTLIREKGITAIIVTHDLNLAEKTDRVFKLINGRFAA